jgi:uncharacterized membrane protein YfcA
LTVPIVLLCALGGLVAGVVNTVAGGGSLLTLPILIFAGLPPKVANGTNRIPILIQNVFAVTRFSRGKVLRWRVAILLAVPAAIGAAAGAWTAAILGEVAFRRVLAGVLILVLIPVFAKPEKRLAGAASGAARVTPLAMVLFLGVGFYGGFVQAGVGFLILGVTVLACGFDLVRANAIKVLIVLVYTLVVIPVFLAGDMVAWYPAIAMSVGQAAGGWLGAHLAIRKGVPFIRLVLVVVSVLAAFKLLFFP